VFLAVAVVGGIAFWGARKVKQVVEEMKDPAKRAEKVGRMLGTTSFPEGYHPMMGFSIPFILDLAILSDREPDFSADHGGKGAFRERGFVFVRVRGGRSGKGDLESWMAGKGGSPEGLREKGIRTETKEIVRRGEVEVGGGRVRWVAQRGTIDVERQKIDGILTTMTIDCGTSSGHSRFAIWFGPDPDPSKKPEELDVTGTPADEEALRAFLGHFQLCGQ
jgi:hypothetical protein